MLFRISNDNSKRKVSLPEHFQKLTLAKKPLLVKNLIFTLSLLFSTIGFGQDYIPIFEGYDSVKWNNVFGYIDFFSGSNEYRTRFARIDSIVIDSTIIDSGNEYREFKYSNTFSFGNKTILIREDTANGRVYAKLPNGKEEYLIYDFSLEVGDEFDFYLLSSSVDSFNFYCTFLVESVAFEDFFGVSRKVIKFKTSRDCWIEPFVEGIGTLGGFEYFYNKYYWIDGTSPNVLCTFKNGEKVFGDSICFKELIPTNTEKIESEFYLKIFPNPTDNQLVIKNTSQNILSGKLKITDLTGRIFIEKQIRFKEEIRIEEVEKLVPGIYFLSLETDEGRMVNKFIKN